MFYRIGKQLEWKAFSNKIAGVSLQIYKKGLHDKCFLANFLENLFTEELEATVSTFFVAAGMIIVNTHAVFENLLKHSKQVEQKQVIQVPTTLTISLEEPPSPHSYAKGIIKTRNTAVMDKKWNDSFYQNYFIFTWQNVIMFSLKYKVYLNLDSN